MDSSTALITDAIQRSLKHVVIYGKYMSFIMLAAKADYFSKETCASAYQANDMPIETVLLPPRSFKNGHDSALGNTSWLMDPHRLPKDI